MKRLIAILILALLLLGSFQSMAQPTIKVTVNGKLISFPVDPTIIDNTTMVPMREIFDALGATVVWDGATKSVIGEREGIKVQLTLNSKNATRNGSVLPLKVAAQLVNGKTMVPTRFISESLGATVTWEEQTKTVIITDDFKAIDSIPIDIRVHYIDVGQGDAIFIDAGDYDILIDAGDKSSGQKVVEYLNELDTDDIEILVATHPHDGHIGGLPAVMKEFKVKQIIDSGVIFESDAYTDYMNAVTIETAQGASFNYDSNMTFDIADNVKFHIIETFDDHEDANENSVICKLVVGDTSFLFMGNAGFDAESKLTEEEVQCDVLKVAHHGSRTSSSLNFLMKTGATYGVISCGKDNPYGHPHKETLDALKKAKIYAFRTDAGSMMLGTNGKVVSIIGKIINTHGEKVTIDDNNNNVQIVNINKSDEIVAIMNIGNENVYLEGWRLVSEKGNQVYTFPNIELKPNSTIYITSGPEAKDDGKNYFKWTTAYIWNNSGEDPGSLYDSSDVLVDRWTK